MNTVDLTVAEQLAAAASELQLQRSGHAPSAVAVVLSEDTLVMTLHEALTLAEKELARSPSGAARVQEFHRQLFSSSADSMRLAIEKITGRKVREAVGEVDTATGNVVHAFASGAVVQVFLLTPIVPAPGAMSHSAIDRVERAEDDGLPVVPEAERTG
jgi:uncharacterized protein YbcI